MALGCYAEEIEAMKYIIGLKIVGVEEYWNNNNDCGIRVVLENGEWLEGRDGEYGDNALWLCGKYVEKP
jgi:hypothetical protein